MATLHNCCLARHSPTSAFDHMPARWSFIQISNSAVKRRPSGSGCEALPSSVGNRRKVENWTARSWAKTGADASLCAILLGAFEAWHPELNGDALTHAASAAAEGSHVFSMESRAMSDKLLINLFGLTINADGRSGAQEFANERIKHRTIKYLRDLRSQTKRPARMSRAPIGPSFTLGTMFVPADGRRRTCRKSWVGPKPDFVRQSRPLQRYQERSRSPACLATKPSQR